jgi:hypothetical protein
VNDDPGTCTASETNVLFPMPQKRSVMPSPLKSPVRMSCPPHSPTQKCMSALWVLPAEFLAFTSHWYSPAGSVMPGVTAQYAGVGGFAGTQMAAALKLLENLGSPVTVSLT